MPQLYGCTVHLPVRETSPGTCTAIVAMSYYCIKCLEVNPYHYFVGIRALCRKCKSPLRINITRCGEELVQVQLREDGAIVF